MIGKSILHYKILEKLGEGGSPREIENYGFIQNLYIIISQGKGSKHDW